MSERIRLFLAHARERLWVRPLAISILSVLVVFLAKLADRITVPKSFPHIDSGSLNALLTVLPATMMTIAVFAVGSMVSAYSSASTTATPRTFSLVLADDVSQNALSAFIGAFIFGLVALVAFENSFYGSTGRFVLFLITILVFAAVILTFLRWVDGVARLGRLGHVMENLEAVTEKALRRRGSLPTLGAKKATGKPRGAAIFPDEPGYVQWIDMAALQEAAEAEGLRVTIAALPGVYVAPNRPLAYVQTGSKSPKGGPSQDRLMTAFAIKDARAFADDPRFGLVVLSETASRALSPAVNDPGTAIGIIGALIRLFIVWERSKREGGDDNEDIKYDRIAVPELSLEDMFDDAFDAIARDGAGLIEVALWLQKAFSILAAAGDPRMREVATTHARRAVRYAEKALPLPEEVERVRAATGCETA